jgi:KDO2-lipid IV(A) lauroyltransferase
MKIRNQFEYSATAAVLGLCRILPEACIYALFRFLGHLCFGLLRRRRKLALDNTAIAFPELDLAARRKLIHKNFINLAESMAVNALIMSGRITNERIFDMVETDDWAILDEACKTAKNGVVVFSGHLGNWELMSQYLGLRLDKPLNVVARAANNPILEERVISPLRERFGVKVFFKKNAMFNLVKAAKRGEVSGLLIDQRLGLKNGIRSEFFGRPAGTTTTPALMQIRFGTATIPLFMVRAGKRKYRLVINAPVLWTDNGKPMEEQSAELTLIHQKIIENAVRTYPDQWFWMHDRWRMNRNAQK